MVAHTYNHNDWETTNQDQELEGHIWLYGEFEGSLGYMQFCFKTVKLVVSKERLSISHL